MAAAAAVQATPEVARDTETVRRNWLRASVVLIGSDQAPSVAGLGLPARRNVHLCGQDATALTTWSVPLDASVMVLPAQTGFVSSLLAEGGEASEEAPVIVRIVGGSGGVGATTLAAGLAQRAAKHEFRVALAELDSTGGGIDLLFGAEQMPGWRWPDLSSASGHISDLSGQLPNVSGVDLISTGRPRLDPTVRGATGLPGIESINAVIASLTRTHDVVILDAGSHPDDPARSRAVTVLVVAAEVKAVMAARSRIAAWGLGDALIVLRKGPGWHLDVETVCETLGLPVIGTLPHDSSLPGLQEAGTPPGMKRGKYSRACDAILVELMRDEG